PAVPRDSPVSRPTPSEPASAAGSFGRHSPRKRATAPVPRVRRLPPSPYLLAGTLTFCFFTLLLSLRNQYVNRENEPSGHSRASTLISYCGKLLRNCLSSRSMSRGSGVFTITMPPSSSKNLNG